MAQYETPRTQNTALQTLCQSWKQMHPSEPDPSSSLLYLYVKSGKADNYSRFLISLELVVAQWPGGTHDSFVPQNNAVGTRLSQGVQGDGCLLGK